MAVIRVNADTGGLVLDEPVLRAALNRLPEGAPVVAMIHGFRFQPDLAGQCPHEHILALRPDHPDPRAISWPRHLGFGRDENGLGLAFGWHARGTLWSAHARAARAGGALADLVGLVRQIDPGRKVDVIAHSLGARVVLSALSRLEPGAIDIAILMSAAEFRGPADLAMATPAGRRLNVLNVTTRANQLFDFLLESLLSGGMHASLAYGLSRPHPGWTDLQSDDPQAELALRQLGYRLGQAPARICHWSPFLRPGLFRLYRAVLTRRLPMSVLQEMLPRHSPRRLRSLLPPNGGAGLPLSGRMA